MNKIKLNGIVYMKNGTIINESTETECTKEDAETLLKELQNNIERAFQEKMEGNFKIGKVIFRFSEIAAIKLVLE